MVEQPRSKSNGRRVNQTIGSPRSPVNLTIGSDHLKKSNNYQPFNQSKFSNPKVSVGSSGNYRSPSSSNNNSQPRTTRVTSQRATKPSSQPSIREYTKDVEFIQFLKNISLFVTDDQGMIGAEMLNIGDQSQLYKNLEFLR